MFDPKIRMKTEEFIKLLKENVKHPFMSVKMIIKPTRGWDCELSAFVHNIVGEPIYSQKRPGYNKKNIEETGDIIIFISNAFSDQDKKMNTNDILDELSGIYSNAALQQLTDDYDVSVIHIIDETGIIRYSSDSSYLDFDMKSGIQSREFMVLVNGDKEEFVQAYGPSTIDPNISMKYAGVKIEGVGFIQVGYDASRFQTDIYEQVKEAAKFRHVSQSGYIIICDENSLFFFKTVLE